jgi:hypothetical protein
VSTQFAISDIERELSRSVYKLVFYVPESHLEVTKAAVFDAGAGTIGNYDRCCWQVLGQGQFRSLSGSRPYLGQLDELESVAEYRVELVCRDECIAQAIVELKRVHPYEEPAYDVWSLAEI